MWCNKKVRVELLTILIVSQKTFPIVSNPLFKCWNYLRQIFKSLWVICSSVIYEVVQCWKLKTDRIPISPFKDIPKLDWINAKWVCKNNFYLLFQLEEQSKHISQKEDVAALKQQIYDLSMVRIIFWLTEMYFLLDSCFLNIVMLLLQCSRNRM